MLNRDVLQVIYEMEYFLVPCNRETQTISDRAKTKIRNTIWKQEMGKMYTIGEFFDVRTLHPYYFCDYLHRFHLALVHAQCLKRGYKLVNVSELDVTKRNFWEDEYEDYNDYLFLALDLTYEEGSTYNPDGELWDIQLFI